MGCTAQEGHVARAVNGPGDDRRRHQRRGDQPRHAAGGGDAQAGEAARHIGDDEQPPEPVAPRQPTPQRHDEQGARGDRDDGARGHPVEARLDRIDRGIDEEHDPPSGAAEGEQPCQAEPRLREVVRQIPEGVGRRPLGRRHRRILLQAQEPEQAHGGKGSGARQREGNPVADLVLQIDAEPGADGPHAGRIEQAQRFEAAHVPARDVIHEIKREGDLEARHAEHLKHQAHGQAGRRAERDHQRCDHQKQPAKAEHPAPSQQPHQPGDRQAEAEIGEANREVKHADRLGIAQQRERLQRYERDEQRPADGGKAEQNREGAGAPRARGPQPHRYMNLSHASRFLSGPAGR